MLLSPYIARIGRANEEVQHFLTTEKQMALKSHFESVVSVIGDKQKFWRKRIMFDIQATIRWVKAVLADPEEAARNYKETAPTWQQSFMQLTLPAYGAAYLVAGLLALVTGGSLLLGSLSFGVFLFSVLWSIAWTFVIAYIFNYLSGTFGGDRDYNAAYAVVALAIVPAAAGAALGPLPWFGWIISLAGSIYTLMLAYRFLPVFLNVPDAARVKHFALSVIAAIVINLLVSLALGSMLVGSMMDNADIDRASRSSSGTQSSGTQSSGVLGGFERQADLVEAASNDTFDPPANGKLADRQVRVYTDILAKTKALKERLGGSMDFKEKEPSLSDIFDSVGGAVRLSTAEMEVVKTADGNWAEHQWVKSQLEIARIQQDLNDTTEHNYRLFLKYQDVIEPQE